MNVSLRLLGPLTENGTGRLEVFYNKTWGAICDDGWDINYARIACRLLGYPGAVKSIPGGQVSYENGAIIWLAHVTCPGRGKSLTNCSDEGWGGGNTSCRNLEIAGVECQKTGSKYVL